MTWCVPKCLCPLKWCTYGTGLNIFSQRKEPITKLPLHHAYVTHVVLNAYYVLFLQENANNIRQYFAIVSFYTIYE